VGNRHIGSATRASSGAHLFHEEVRILCSAQWPAVRGMQALHIMQKLTVPHDGKWIVLMVAIALLGLWLAFSMVVVLTRAS
jgi:hypothetical protein